MNYKIINPKQLSCSVVWEVFTQFGALSEVTLKDLNNGIDAIL